MWGRSMDISDDEGRSRAAPHDTRLSADSAMLDEGAGSQFGHCLA